MEPSRSSSRSRRSYPNLNNLSLAPLSSKYPFDASTPVSPSEDADHIPSHTSYIAHKSAPSTPGILSLSHSRSNSRNRNSQRRAKGFAYDSYFLHHNLSAPVRDVGDIPKAKSTGAMHLGVSFADEESEHERKRRHHERKGTAPLPLRPSIVRRHTHETNEDWLHRAGLTIAGEMRDSKGQGWLLSRDSSTSLVHQTNDYEEHPSHNGRHVALSSGEHFAEALDFNSWGSPRVSRVGSRLNSRMGSRAASARNSRRGSKVGSRVDLLMHSGLRTPGGRLSFELDDEVFEEDVIEPDFVEGDEESGDDEEEVARLARERGFGLGGLMDRLIGWTLFSVDEDGEGSDEDDDGDEDGSVHTETTEEIKLRREVESRRRKMEREAIIAAAAVRSEDNSHKSPEGAEAPNEEGGGWSDAAWLFSVASKSLWS